MKKVHNKIKDHRSGLLQIICVKYPFKFWLQIHHISWTLKSKCQYSVASGRTVFLGHLLSSRYGRTIFLGHPVSSQSSCMFRISGRETREWVWRQCCRHHCHWPGWRVLAVSTNDASRGRQGGVGVSARRRRSVGEEEKEERDSFSFIRMRLSHRSIFGEWKEEGRRRGIHSQHVEGLIDLTDSHNIC